MDIRFDRRQEICGLIIIVTILFGISMYGFTYSLTQDEHRYYKIDNIKYAEKFTNIPDEGIDKHYTLSESGLDNHQKQQIMNKESVIINDSDTFETVDSEDKTVALTTDNSAYIGNIEVYPQSFEEEWWVLLSNILLTTIIIPVTYALGYTGYDADDYEEDIYALGYSDSDEYEKAIVEGLVILVLFANSVAFILLLVASAL
jgi:hypothetical protein